MTVTWAVCVSLLDTRSAAEARLPHRGKKNCSRTTLAYSFLYYFFILYMYHSIYIISLLSVYSHFSRIPSLLLLNQITMRVLSPTWEVALVKSILQTELLIYVAKCLMSFNVTKRTVNQSYSSISSWVFLAGAFLESLHHRSYDILTIVTCKKMADAGYPLR